MIDNLLLLVAITDITVTRCHLYYCDTYYDDITVTHYNQYYCDSLSQVLPWLAIIGVTMTRYCQF